MSANASDNAATGRDGVEGLDRFTEYFVRNYPGPDTVIFDPKWHAPRIYRAALAARDPAPQAAVTTHAMDVKALETARFIADLEGRDRRSQFVSRIQVAVLDAMRWMKPAPQAPADAGEAVAWNVLQIGNVGAAYDLPNTHRAFTYDRQPGNIAASKLGRATIEAAEASAGDSIDRGLAMLKALQAEGFGVFQIGAPQPAPAHAVGEGQGRAATLWCLHIIGPDDVHPAPSREHAQKAADLFNAAFADKRDLMHAVASPWPHTASSHADSVGRFIAEWMIPQSELTAAPPPPAGDAKGATPADAGVVGTLNVRAYRGMENYDFDYTGNLPDGTYSVYTTPQPPAPARVEVDDTMVERACAAYSALSCKPFTQHHPQKMRAALTAALAPQAEQAGGEVGDA